MDKFLINKIGATLIKKKKTVAVAESVTAGNVQAALSLAKDARKFFQGGITAYNLGQKARHLDIEPIEAEASNCVSEVVAKQMAKRICESFLTDYGIGITGYASTVPEEGITKLFAFVCIATKTKNIVMKKISCPKMSPHRAQHFYTEEVLKLFEKAIRG